MKLRSYYIYILSNSRRTVLYTGVTSNLERRLFEHSQGLVDGFTKQYNVHDLLYYEVWDTVDAAIAREKQLKKWHREWKLNLIKELNPDLVDITSSFAGNTGS